MIKEFVRSWEYFLKIMDMKFVLYILFKNKGTIVSRMEIMDYLWDNSIFIDDNTLSVNITRIRSKLKELGIYDFICTKHGQGYMI